VRKTPLVLLTWVLGTAGSVLVGSLGVQLVTSVVTPARVSPLTRPEVLAALSMNTAAISEPVTPPTVPPAAADAGPGAGETPSTPPDNPAPGAQRRLPDPLTAAKPGPAPAPAPAAGGEEATSKRERLRKPTPDQTQAPVLLKPGSAPAAGSKPSPAASVPGSRTLSTVRTIQSNGGTVAVRFEAGKAVLEWARPNAGFEVHVFAKGPGVVVVEFGGSERTSRIRAWWDEEGPRQKVREINDWDGHDGGHEGSSDD
jgi:hypothetical protein